MIRHRRITPSPAATALALLASLLASVAFDGREALAGPRLAWRGPDGESLPFASDDEALEFLASAEVVASEEIPDGTSRTLRVLLERGGVRAHAAFRTVDLHKSRVKLGDEVILDFHDSYRHEVAAYELNRLLGLDRVPPTVPRTLNGERGSLQLWVEGAMTEGERIRSQTEPPDPVAWYRQLQVMRIFDRLIYNFDRNRGNILIGEGWKLWMIDHTRSFRLETEVSEIRSVTQCERSLWRRLRELDEDEVRSRLVPYVGPRQVRALVKRRDKVVAHVEGLIEQFGEEHVLFDLAGALLIFRHAPVDEP